MAHSVAVCDGIAIHNDLARSRIAHTVYAIGALPFAANVTFGTAVTVGLIENRRIRWVRHALYIITQRVDRLIALLRPHPGTELFVGLFASPEADGLYASLGFTSTGARGMHRTLSA